MTSTTVFHSLPTHLGVRDPVLWGLDDVQLRKLGVGALVVGFVWRLSAVPVGARGALSVAALLAASAFALVRIDGRPLDEWLLIGGRYLARPRAMVWRSRRPDHPWARSAATVRSLEAGGGVRARYCLRNIRVRWAEPARQAAT